MKRQEELKKRLEAFDKMTEKFEDKKARDLARSIEYINFFLSRKIKIKEVKKENK